MEIEKYYSKVVDAINLLANEDNFNSLILVSKPGLGKSFWVDKALASCGKPFVIFKGAVSEAKFFEFINEHKDKIICMRDCGNLLRKLTFLDFLKSATDLTKERKISRLNYAEHENLPETINFTGKIIWEANALPTKNKDDFEAIVDRSLYVELNFNNDEIKDIMYQICQNQEEKEITDYLLSIKDKLGSDMNIRLQKKCIDIYNACKRENKEWKDYIIKFIFNELPESKKIMYRFSGNKPAKRSEFVKYLMKTKNVSFATAQRRIKIWLYLEELYTNKQKQGLISTEPIIDEKEKT